MSSRYLGTGAPEGGGGMVLQFLWKLVSPIPTRGQIMPTTLLLLSTHPFPGFSDLNIHIGMYSNVLRHFVLFVFVLIYLERF